MWMIRGQNEERCLSGSIPWRTGQVFLTPGKPKQGCNTALFLAHRGELRSRLRRSKEIPVICDSARCHASDEVAVDLWEHRERIALHLLPKSSPDRNPIERVWWDSHDR